MLPPTATLTLQRLDARHRVHARVEDHIRTGKDTGLGHLPSKSWQVNNAWCQAVAIARDLLAWFKPTPSDHSNHGLPVSPVVSWLVWR